MFSFTNQNMKGEFKILAPQKHFTSLNFTQKKLFRYLEEISVFVLSPPFVHEQN